MSTRVQLILAFAFSIATVAPSLAYARTLAFICEDVFSPTTSALDPAKGEINFQLFGAEHDRSIVILHGIGGSLVSKIPYAKELAARGFKVVIYDQRGHGKSIARGNNYSTDVMAEDLRSLLDYLNIQKTVVLGHSMGARVAARFAIEHPERVENLVLEDMDLIPRTSAEPEKQRRAYLKALEVRRRLRKPYDSRRAFVKAMSPFHNKPDLASLGNKAKMDRFQHWSNPDIAPDIYLLYWNQANSDNLLTPLAKTNVRTLMFRADANKFSSAMTKEGVLRVQKEMPQARLIEIPNSKHSVRASQPKAYNDALFAFLHG